MSFFLPGVVPINSTFAPVANPSTATLLAELESTNFQVDANTRQQQRIYALSIWAGGSTGGYWVAETATSTALNATVDSLFFRTASGQTSQFFWKVRLNAWSDRIRVRHVSTATATFECKLSAEEID